jgi:hypothetical protein
VLLNEHVINLRKGNVSVMLTSQREVV